MKDSFFPLEFLEPLMDLKSYTISWESSNNMAAGLTAVDRQQHARVKVADLLLNSKDDDTEDDFSDFIDVSESNDDDQ